MTTISNLPRVTSLTDQSLFLVTENGVTKVVTWEFIRTTAAGYRGSAGYIGSQGFLGYTGSTGAGYIGSTGPQGPRGPAGGFTGSFGFTGSIGAGWVGSTGYWGSRGDLGFVGSIGFSGSIGYFGSRGFVGSQGPQGPQGPAGGFTGSQGLQGPAGPAGGYTGSAGGYTGSTGAGYTGSASMTPGYTGSIGNTGPKGESSFTYGASAPVTPAIGDRWLDANSGRELVWFNDGNSVQWIEVAGGRVGFIGSQGEPGIPGGYTGSRGATGIGGLGYTGSGAGFTGSSGAYAALGYTGSGGSGPLGYAGSRGEGYTGSSSTIPGFTGSRGQGYTGSLGQSGPIGYSGSQGGGFVGSRGSVGSLGYTGSLGSGYTGSQGIAGNVGYFGSRGTTGFAGSKGIDGYWGSTGFLGYTGSNGIPGTPGQSGYVGSRGVKGISWTYNVKDYGARGDNSSDATLMTAETTAIQAAINAAQTTGGTVFFPAGTYRINSPLAITTNAQDPGARPHLLGEGIGASSIIQNSVAGGITVTGNASSPNTYVTIKGLSIIGSQAGTGLSFSDSGNAKLSDVQLINWGTGLYGIDTLNMLIEKCVIRYNNTGFKFERASTGQFTSNPIAISMISCVVSNNTSYGGHVIGAGTFNYIGGTIQSNASGTTESTSNWGLRITDPGGDVSGESSVGFNLSGVNFNANGGRANLWIDATELNSGVVGAITGCSFVRQGTSYSTNNIRCEASNAGYAFPIAIVGCGFRGFNAYIVSQGRPNIFNLSNMFALNTVSCKFSSTLDAYVIPIPVNSSSVGTPGMITSDANYAYICVADNKWYRYAAETF